MRKRFTASNWAVLLGGIGAHHFYLGNTWLGVLYLFFFWTGIPVVVGFFEAVYFRWFITDEKFNEKYNSTADIGSLNRLEKLHDLKAKGAISEEEFQKQKKKLIA